MIQQKINMNYYPCEDLDFRFSVTSHEGIGEKPYTMSIHSPNIGCNIQITPDQAKALIEELNEELDLNLHIKKIVGG